MPESRSRPSCETVAGISRAVGVMLFRFEFLDGPDLLEEAGELDRVGNQDSRSPPPPGPPRGAVVRAAGRA